MMSLLLAASLMLLMLMVPGVVVAFHFFSVYMSPTTLCTRNLYFRREPREKLQRKIYIIRRSGCRRRRLRSCCSLRSRRRRLR